jgi:LacI family transcriptional regulator
MANTLYDIARAAGVSRTTVMRALRDRPDINAETKIRIKKIAADLKYRPNSIARSLSLGRSRLIGISADPLSSPAVQAIILAAQQTFLKSGYGILYYVGFEAGSESEELSLEHMMQNRVEGVLAAPARGPINISKYTDLIDIGAKLVIIDGHIDGLSVPQVVPDNYKAGKLGVQHLTSLGHRNIVYLGMPPTYFVGSERLRGVEEAMREAGIAVNAESIIEVECTEEAAASATVILLGRSKPPTALFVRHDIVARGAMRAILQAGLAIPRDISLVGCGGMVDNDILMVPLTTVRLTGEQTIAMGVSKLAKMLKGGYVKPETTILDVELEVRASTAPPNRQI